MSRTVHKAATRTIADLLREAEILAEDFDADLADALRLAVEQPLSEEELRSLFTKVLIRLKRNRKSSSATRKKISVAVRSMVNDLVTEHTKRATRRRRHLPLEDRRGLKVRSVAPAPVFLGKQIELREGFADVTKLRFWPDNHRLELHINEFRKREGRAPDNDQLLDILLSNTVLPGVSARDRQDFFKIRELADSIASNGVRVPPIIDWWGTPYDGNRRLAACLLVLKSEDYSPDQKENARWIRVWQAPEHTTPDQINHIVVALNFEKDLKEPWPEYVRAKQVFDEYEKLCDQGRLKESTPDLTRIRRQVGKKFGIRADEVRRYVRMVEWAQEFREYHEKNGRDEAEILHRTNKYFQYFYELDSGRGDDKLANKLDKDESLKGLVFDLLYEDKFKRWAQIRDLRKVFGDEKATTLLIEAGASPNPDVGKELVEQAIAEARRHDIARKQIGAQQRVEEFTKWLETEATQQTWRKHIDLELLGRFLVTIRAAEGTVAKVLAERTRK